jgi:hypothetical protein
VIPASPGRLTWQQPGCRPTIGRLTMSTISDMAISATLNSAQVGTGPLASVTRLPRGAGQVPAMPYSFDPKETRGTFAYG